MLKKFASVRKILTLGLIISIIFAAYSMYYKITYWGFSFLPKQTTKVWTIEAHVAFSPNGDPIKVSLASPYASDDFKNYTFFTFESVIYSTFINIINNALYWLIPVSERRIYIEYCTENEEILVMNNGEKIADNLLEDIFTLFFTRKSNGRGIGLYLARRNLNSIGLDIIASNDKEYNKLNGACFVIRSYKK